MAPWVPRRETASRFGPGPWCRETPSDWSFYIERRASWAPPNGPTSGVIFCRWGRADVTRWSCGRHGVLDDDGLVSGWGQGIRPIWGVVLDWDGGADEAWALQGRLNPLFCRGGLDSCREDDFHLAHVTEMLRGCVLVVICRLQ